jgi:hypothetical protein
VNGLSCVLILAALVACTGKTGDSSTQTPTLTSSFLSDALVHVPPTAGLYAYNTFTPGSAGLPAVGGIYKDPIFGGVIRRLTNTVGKPNKEDIYGHHWANSNGTLAFTQQDTGTGSTVLHIINTTTGAKVYQNQPLGSVAADIAWDAIDPDKYYYYSGATLMRRNLALQNDTQMKTFFEPPGIPAPLEANGGSLNTQDRSGRYFTVRYGGTNKVWDSQDTLTGGIYSNPVTPLSSDGWVAITPDGNYLLTAAGPNFEHYSYAIDHITQSISLTPVNFWTLCGDHGALVSAANGKNYFITFDCNSGISPGIWRVDITLDQTPLNVTEQHDDNLLLLPLAFVPVNTNDGHLSAVSRGSNQNWVFFDSETFSVDDPFNSDPATSNWQPYEQEIIAMNVVTLEVRRYAHHRSRGLSSSYYAQPRISCSWDGSIILWTSNYNTPRLPNNDYADMYGMAFSN